MITSYDKALVALLVPIIYVALSYFGVLPQMTIEQAVTTAATGAVGFLGVYFAKNK